MVPSDSRKVLVLSLAMEVANRPDVVVELIDPTSPEKTAANLKKLQETSFTLKEGVEYRMKCRFK